MDDEEESGLACPICLEEYNTETVIPLSLPCGHNVCANCCKDLARSKAASCPTCREPLGKMPPKGQFPKAWGLIQVLQAEVNRKRKRAEAEAAREAKRRHEEQEKEDLARAEELLGLSDSFVDETPPPRESDGESPAAAAETPGTATPEPESVEAPAGKWACPQCTLHNDMKKARCTVCDHPRPKKQKKPPPKKQRAPPATPAASEPAAESARSSGPATSPKPPSAILDDDILAICNEYAFE